MAPRPSTAPGPNAIVARAIAGVGYVRRLQLAETSNEVRFVFGGVQFVEPGQSLDRGSTPELELRFVAAGLRVGALPDAAAAGWRVESWLPELLADRLETPLYLAASHFDLDNPALVATLERLAGPTLTMRGVESTRWRHTLAFTLDRAVVVAGGAELHFRLGAASLSLRGLVDAHDAWRTYHRDYWLRKGTAVEPPFDYVCEVSGAPQRD